MLFSFRWRRAIQHDPLGHWVSPAEIAVLLAIHQHMDNDTGECWPKRDTIAREARVHPSTVSEVIGKAVRLGWLEVVRRYNKSNVYRGRIPEDVSRAVSQGSAGKHVGSDDGRLSGPQRSGEATSQVVTAEPNSLGNSPKTSSDGRGVPEHAPSVGEEQDSDITEPVLGFDELRPYDRLFKRLNPLERRRLAERLGLREEAVNPWDLAQADPESLEELWKRYPDNDEPAGDG